MRTLCFIVDGQQLKRDPDCDFSGIVSNSKGYLQARFRFSRDWVGCKKVAIFTGIAGDKMVPLKNDACTIPDEVLTGGTVLVSVVGQGRTVRIPTNTTEFNQKTGR